MDNQVTLEKGGKKVVYRCVLCAVADTKADKVDEVIVAPSEVKDKRIKITRESGKWKVEPDTAVFVYDKGSHSQCQVRYRALTSKDAFDSYVKANPKILGSAKQLTLEEFIKKAE